MSGVAIKNMEPLDDKILKWILDIKGGVFKFYQNPGYNFLNFYEINK